MNKDLDGRAPADAGPGCQPSASAVPASQSGIPHAGIERIDVAEFHRRLKAQGVPNSNHYALVCPICGTVQSMASLVKAGATPDVAERRIGFSCEGRLSGAGPWDNGVSAKRRKVRGCDWSLGGLFRLHKLEVITEDGEANPRFVVATPEQAQALASAMSAGTAETAQQAQGQRPASAVGEAETPKVQPSDPYSINTGEV